MEARSALARSSLPLMRHPSILRTLEEPLQLPELYGRCRTLLSGRECFHEQSSYALLHKQTELLCSSDLSDPFGQGLQFNRLGHPHAYVSLAAFDFCLYNGTGTGGFVDVDWVRYRKVD